MKYTQKIKTKKVTPQGEIIPGRENEMVKNSAGGYIFPMEPLALLTRFLILGSEGGSYYISEQKLTQSNFENITRILDSEYGVDAVNLMVQVVQENRAPKKTPIIFALALAMTCNNDATRQTALASVDIICSIPTDYMMLASYIEDLKGVQPHAGWGSGKRRAFARYYTSTPIDKLAMHVVKYRNREGFTHRDLLRLSHPKTSDEARNVLLKWIAKEGQEVEPEMLPTIISGFLLAQVTKDAKSLVDLIHGYNLTWEMLPTKALTYPSVWKALLQNNMPMGAMIRNLANMTRHGVLGPKNMDVISLVEERLTNSDILQRAKIHPLKVLAAFNAYRSGQGRQGRTWTPEPRIVDALNDAFYVSFKYVEPTNKTFMLAIDVSGSMTWPSSYISSVNMNARDAAAVMAMVTARTEKNHIITGFSNGGYGTGIQRINISSRQRLDNVIQEIGKVPVGGTDCALPMLWATQHKIPVDVFVIYTDNETWAGKIHPSQALQEYRRQLNRPNAKVVTVGMVSNGFTIADPQDPGMIDVVGFDTSVPSVINDFATH